MVGSVDEVLDVCVCLCVICFACFIHMYVYIYSGPHTPKKHTRTTAQENAKI